MANMKAMVVGGRGMTGSNIIKALEAAGELKRITADVSPILEIAEITDRVSKSPDGGDALPHTLGTFRREVRRGRHIRRPSDKTGRDAKPTKQNVGRIESAREDR